MSQKNFLIVYYSGTGKTKKVCEKLQEMLNCDIEAIKDNTKRTGVLGFVKSGFQAFRGLTCDIEPAKTDSSKYDMVILATPVWAGHVSSPVRTYAYDNKQKFKSVAFLCTQKGNGNDKVFDDLFGICTMRPKAQVRVTEKEADAGTFEGKLTEFTGKIK